VQPDRGGSDPSATCGPAGETAGDEVAITWGTGDPFFIEGGARAYLRDVSDAELHLFDARRFALEDKLPDIAPLIAGFLDHTRRRSD
jgi:hypothetical protein